ncbi:twin-arginine translocation pathway signal protein [Pseudomonas sp.]|uniref:twin-arginine translocation pathway signal protein n=1 Tax=Pseudomonas sp. TaxID=306 RepID=UPI0028B1A1BC|nr:twin-arginine translocation pathway signal protein [Pseudomonas sp.]
MTDSIPLISRRRLLRVGLFGSTLLAGAGLLGGLSGCTPEQPAQGFVLLRDSDLPMLRRVTAVMLAGATPEAALTDAVEATLTSLDGGLAYLSPAVAKQVGQLFDLLSLPLTRGPLTGIWGSWAHAGDAEVMAFLLRWENSPIDLLRQGRASLEQMVLMAWYGRPQAWAHCGYPGPPTV